MPAKKLAAATLSLTHSSMTDWLSCPRRYQLKYEEKLSRDSLATPLIIGDIVHNGLSELMLGYDLERALETMRGRIDWARTQNLEDAEDFENDATVVEGMLKGWSRNRGMLTNASVWDFGGTQWVEKVFVWPLNEEVQVTGKIDAVVVRDDGIWAVEHKTAGRVDAGYINRLMVDSQVTTYYWALSKIYGKPIQGTIYNVLVKPSIRQTKKENLAQFQARLLSELEDSKYYFQAKVLRDQSQVLQFERSLDRIAQDIVAERSKRDYLMNTSQCVQIGRVCPMLPLCSNGKKPEILGMYKVREAMHPELEPSIHTSVGR